MKKGKVSDEAHVSRSGKPMGDYYGTGIKAKVAILRDMEGINPASKKQLGTPPKSLA
jgi:hypothetical protein